LLHRCLLLLTLLAAAPALAGGPALSIGLEAAPEATLSAPPVPGAALEAVTAGFEAEWTHAVSARTFLSHALSARSTRLSWRGWGDAAPPVDRFQELGYRLAVTRLLNDPRWSVTVTAEPVLGADLDGDVRSQALNTSVAVLAVRTPDGVARTGFGLAYTFQFGAPVPIPLYLHHREGDRFHVDLLLPGDAEVSVGLSSGLRLGAAFRLRGGQAVFGDGVLPGREPRLQYVQAVLGPRLIWTPRENLRAVLDAGVAVHREWRVMDGDVERERWDPETGPALRLLLTWRPGGGPC